MNKKVFVVLLLLVIFLPLLGQSYVQVIKSEVNVRVQPSSSSAIITQATLGDVFELKNEKGSWFGINMFSGEYRYIHKSLCKVVEYNLEVPENEQYRKQIFQALLEAEDKAQYKADQKYPSDLIKNIDYNRLLIDKYKFKVLKQFKIQAPVYLKIIVEGIKKSWDIY